jgi:hypothetical protein
MIHSFVVSSEGPNFHPPLPTQIQAPNIAVVAPAGIVAPTACRPTAVRPMPLRPSTSRSMLQKIQQEFHENPPPPVESIEIITPPTSSSSSSLANHHRTTSATSLGDDASVGSSTMGSICTSAATPNGLAPMPTIFPPAPILAQPKPLGLRRTMSDTTNRLTSSHTTFDPATAAHHHHHHHHHQVMATQNQIKDLEKQIQDLQKQMAASQQPQLVIPPFHGVALQLTKPVPIRPTPLRASQSHGMLTSLFANPPPHVLPMPHQPSIVVVNPAPPSRPKPPKRQSSSRSMRKPSWYHRVAAQNRLGCIQEDPLLTMPEDVSEDGRMSPVMGGGGGIRSCHEAPCDRIQAAKRSLLQELNRTATMGEDVQDHTPVFQAALQTLIREYDPSHFDPRAPVLSYHPYQLQLEGIGIAVGKPSFPGCIGRNKRGDPMFKLGTMSFGKCVLRQRRCNFVDSVVFVSVLLFSQTTRGTQTLFHHPSHFRHVPAHRTHSERSRYFLLDRQCGSEQPPGSQKCTQQPGGRCEGWNQPGSNLQVSRISVESSLGLARPLTKNIVLARTLPIASSLHLLLRYGVQNLEKRRPTRGLSSQFMVS